MNKIVIACMMCLACASVASAGYTDSLWNESEERIYFDCGDWSGVDNHKNDEMGYHYYRFRKSCSHDGRYLSTLTNWGYPSDAKSSGGVSDDIAWCCLHINGFDKTLNMDGIVYTDDQFKINYKTSYMRFKGFTTQHWRLQEVHNEIIITDIGGTMNVMNRIIFESEHKTDDGPEKKTTARSPRDDIEYRLWNEVSQAVCAEMVNHYNYITLNMVTPANVTGVKIVATSKNTTAIYEKHTHCLKLNETTQFMTCDLVECKYHRFVEIIPFGHDSYLLQYEPDYDINVTLYTPFTTIDANVAVNETDAEPINTDLKYDTIWDLLYLAVPISLIIGLTRLM